MMRHRKLFKYLPICLPIFILFFLGINKYGFSDTGPVSIDAVLTPNGTLEVTERRTFYKSEHGVYWTLGSADNPVDIESAGIVGKEGSFSSFRYSSSKANKTYDIEGIGEQTVKLYNHSNLGQPITYQIKYTLDNVGVRYSDVSELYWKFIGDEWQGSTEDITCTIYLPVQKGETIVSEQNTWAFGHGPLDGDVSFNGSSIVYKVPKVRHGSFAEARVLFPATWLSSDAKLVDEDHLQSTLAEEKEWGEQANVRREQAKVFVQISLVLTISASIVMVIIFVRYYRKKRAFNSSVFDDMYYSDRLDDIHPAVLDHIYHGKATEDGLSACIMRLLDKKILQFAEPSQNGYFIVKTHKIARAHAIDKLFFELFLEQFLISEKPKEVVSKTAKGDAFIKVDAFKNASKEEKEVLADSFTLWKNKIEVEAIAEGLEVPILEESKEEYSYGHIRHIGVTAALVGGISFAVCFILFWIAGFSWFMWLLLLPLLAIFLSLCILLWSEPGIVFTDDGFTLYLKMKALKRWLKDFTSLSQSVSQDVVLWNQYMIYATILRISKKVAEELQATIPEVTENPGFVCYIPINVGVNVGSFLNSSFGGGAFFSGLGTSIANAASSGSSSFGGGGGFSGGGGGGAGGGGGGSF